MVGLPAPTKELKGGVKKLVVFAEVIEVGPEVKRAMGSVACRLTEHPLGTRLLFIISIEHVAYREDAHEKAAEYEVEVVSHLDRSEGSKRALSVEGVHSYFLGHFFSMGLGEILHILIIFLFAIFLRPSHGA